MKNLIKQISSLILPLTVLVFIPSCIEKNISITHLSILLAGIIIMCIGLSIMVLTITSFIRGGKGTLAPWSPTSKLVTSGMYGYVRNPMITGVLIVLLGESIAVLSLNILIWAIIFFIINNLFFILYEEPNLGKKFGNEYREYKKNVPRWIPRTSSFNPDSEFN
jgi:protein-S-isoprenylcysteine O-methyltransferase Ste14